MAACYKQIQAPDFKDLYLTGAVFSNSPHSAFPLYLASNVLDLPLPVRIYLDRKQCLPVLALLKKAIPDMFESIWKKEVTEFECLGTLLVIDPTVKKVTLEFSGRAESEELYLKKETLSLIEVPTGENATISIEGGKDYFVSGGTVGLIFDTRKRPISFPDSERDRRMIIRDWEKSINSHGEIEPLWKE
jgi:hypothetical protein